MTNDIAYTNFSKHLKNNLHISQSALGRLTKQLGEINNIVINLSGSQLTFSIAPPSLSKKIKASIDHTIPDDLYPVAVALELLSTKTIKTKGSKTNIKWDVPSVGYKNDYLQSDIDKLVNKHFKVHCGALDATGDTSKLPTSRTKLNMIRFVYLAIPIKSKANDKNGAIPQDHKDIEYIVGGAKFTVKNASAPHVYEEAHWFVKTKRKGKAVELSNRELETKFFFHNKENIVWRFEGPAGKTTYQGIVYLKEKTNAFFGVKRYFGGFHRIDLADHSNDSLGVWLGNVFLEILPDNLTDVLPEAGTRFTKKYFTALVDEKMSEWMDNIEAYSNVQIDGDE